MPTIIFTIFIYIGNFLNSFNGINKNLNYQKRYKKLTLYDKKWLVK